MSDIFLTSRKCIFSYNYLELVFPQHVCDIVTIKKSKLHDSFDLTVNVHVIKREINDFSSSFSAFSSPSELPLRLRKD